MNAPEFVSKKPFPKSPARVSSWDATRKRELGLIHMAKAHLGLSREDYEFVIREVTRTNKTSSADLTDAERNTLLQHFKRMGFTVKPKADAARPLPGPQHRKLRALYYTLADAGAVVRPVSPMACDQAVETWAKRQLGTLDALRFASSDQLNKLIEEMKSWARRVTAKTV
ncbi:regulatory protein GemA [Variovorax sp. E3]|uniref:regulatory protein GemA n=1 Tax=Variovorax sp. E3 TaxID=1914993 RepID=UPI0018DD45F8|nr:regulatory protein GemA [Variovorax sp. E3]